MIHKPYSLGQHIKLLKQNKQSVTGLCFGLFLFAVFLFSKSRKSLKAAKNLL